MTMLLEEGPFTSKHLKGSAELLLMIPIKPGFVDVSETMSYATRLKDLLGAFFAFRKRTADVTLKNTPQPIELLEIIYAAQWTVLEQERKLLVAVTFDRSWEEYFARLEAITGYLLDALFMHCVGYDGHTSLDGFSSFTDWIRSHQRPTDFLFQSSPDLTTRDIRSLRELARKVGRATLDGVDDLKPIVKAHKISDVLSDVKDGIPADDDLQVALRSLYELRHYFPDGELILQRDTQRSAQKIFDQAVASLLDPVFQLLEKQGGDKLQTIIGTLHGRAPQNAAWVMGVHRIAVDSRKLPEPKSPAPEVAADSVQANILRAIPDQPHGAVVLIQCHGPTGLSKLMHDQVGAVSWELGKDAAPGTVYRNLAITYGGLTRAQLPESTLRLLPKEFREGMEQRAALLGDIGEPNHPNFWLRPLAANDNGDVTDRRLSLAAVDAVIVLQAHEQSDVDKQVDKLRDGGDTHYSVVHVQRLARQKLDAFGLREGFSQPKPQFVLDGTPMNENAAEIDRVPLGEILLGYKDRQDIVALCVQDGDRDQRTLFENGTFLVMRKLEQDAKQFAKMLSADGAGAAAIPVATKSRILGRDVAKLNAAETYDVANDFDYTDDGEGLKCPLQAHARLSNPRFHGKTMPLSTPRILRRGVSYDDSATDAGRGLIFMAYNASITSQYETIQRWLNAGNITGLFSWQNDALTGPTPAIPYPQAYGECPVARTAAPEQPCVKLRWGMYLFVPSKQSMQWLAGRQPQLLPDSDASAGRDLIHQLQALAVHNPAEAVQEWKRLIEDPAYDLQARQIWTAIRLNGGELETPYGRLVANLERARPVLNDNGSKFSVDVYGRRLEETMAPHYLGLDAHRADYQALAAANECFNKALKPEAAFEKARDIAREVLKELAVPGDAGRKYLWIEPHFAKPVIRGLAKAWFGLPDAQAGVDWFEHLVDVSRYSFQPHPQEALAARLRDQRKRMDLNAYPIAGELGAELKEKYLRGRDENIREQAIRTALVGGVAGFSAPAIAQIMSVLDKWIESDELGWLSERIHHNGAPSDDLMRMLLEALARRPVPPLLYRTDLHDGARVIVGLGSVYRDVQQHPAAYPGERAEAWLFGGRHAWDGKPQLGRAPHACPARDAGLRAVLGAVTAILECKNIKRESRLVISFDA